MNTRTSAPLRLVAGAAVLAASGAGVLLAQETTTRPGGSTHATAGKAVAFKDARLKFEVNATDRDAGVHLYVDAEAWKDLELRDPAGRTILRTTTAGRIAKQGGTELFLESAEPTFSQLSLARLFVRFPAGRYRVRATGLKGERYVGSAVLDHVVPAGPQLVAPLPASGPQPVNDTTVSWKTVPDPKGGRIVGYQVLVVHPGSGIRAIPKVTLDVTMPPNATSLRVPPGFLRPGVEYEWEVLAIDRGGNQTLSSSTFTTAS